MMMMYDDIKKVFEKIEAGLTAVWTVIKTLSI
jgi:hypothetical protein